jgi:hypothetical protein
MTVLTIGDTQGRPAQPTGDAARDVVRMLRSQAMTFSQRRMSSSIGRLWPAILRVPRSSGLPDTIRFAAVGGAIGLGADRHRRCTKLQSNQSSHHRVPMRWRSMEVKA